MRKVKSALRRLLAAPITAPNGKTKTEMLLEMKKMAADSEIELERRKSQGK